MYYEPSLGPDTEDNAVNKALSWSLSCSVENINTDKDVSMSSILVISTNKNKPRKGNTAKMRESEGSVLSSKHSSHGQGSNSVDVGFREAELWGNKSQSAQVLGRGRVAL